MRRYFVITVLTWESIQDSFRILLIWWRGKQPDRDSHNISKNSCFHFCDDSIQCFCCCDYWYCRQVLSWRGKDGERDTFCVVTTAVPLLSIRPFIRHDDDEEHASAKSTRILPFIQLKKNSRPYIYYCAFQKEQRKFVFLKSSWEEITFESVCLGKEKLLRAEGPPPFMRFLSEKRF